MTVTPINRSTHSFSLPDNKKWFDYELLSVPVFQVIYQFIGILAVGLFTVIFSLIVFLIIKYTLGLRVSSFDEERGLDVAEHKVKAYFFD